MTGPRRPAPPRRPVPRTRGRLPQSVYWRRRITLLTVAAVLVIGLVALLHHGGSSGPGRAADVSQVTAPAPKASRRARPTPADTTPPAPTQSPSTTLSALPNGDCQDSDVVVTPSVSAAVYDQPVSIRLALTSASTPTCTWTLGPRSVQVAVKHAGFDVWNTATCHGSLPTETLTLVQGTPSYVSITWGGHVGTDGCSVHNDWAGLGTYKVQAAALGGRPSSTTFEIGRPVETVGPSPTESASSSSSPSADPSSGATKTTGKRRAHKHRSRKHKAGAKASASSSPTAAG